MPTPHKHAALIKAWADNPSLEIQFCPYEGANWRATPSPTWEPSYQYRIKPPVKKIRIALFAHNGQTWFPPCPDDKTSEQYVNSPDFVRWLTDWIEYGE